MDYHAGPMQCRMIQEIVTTRVGNGSWRMELDSRAFLVKFHPVTTSVVDVGMESPSMMDTTVSLGKEDAEEMINGEMGPW
jgi:hypothetical protein